MVVACGLEGDVVLARIGEVAALRRRGEVARIDGDVAAASGVAALLRGRCGLAGGCATAVAAATLTTAAVAATVALPPP